MNTLIRYEDRQYAPFFKRLPTFLTLNEDPLEPKLRKLMQIDANYANS